MEYIPHIMHIFFFKYVVLEVKNYKKGINDFCSFTCSLFNSMCSKCR